MLPNICFGFFFFCWFFIIYLFSINTIQVRKTVYQIGENKCKIVFGITEQ